MTQVVESDTMWKTGPLMEAVYIFSLSLFLYLPLK